MTSTLFDTRTLDPGTRGRFAEDRWAPMRIRVSRWVPANRGPAIGLYELAEVIGKQLSHYGVDVHGTDAETEVGPDGRTRLDGTYAVIDCSLLAESQAHAAELFAGLCDRAIEELDSQWEWFDHNPATQWNPGVSA